jgi:hypothetical protein
VFGRAVWEEAVVHLQHEVAEKGEDLASWLGEGVDAHRATFAVMPRDEVGMKIVQVSSPEAHESHRLIFQVFMANCDEGLQFFPPAFAPGPPWGACFWARRSWALSYDGGKRVVGSNGGSSAEAGDNESSGGSRLDVSVMEASSEATSAKLDHKEQDVYPTDLLSGADPCRESGTFLDDASMPDWLREQIGSDTVAKANGHRSGEALGCTCAEQRSRVSVCPVASNMNEDAEEDIGAWLKWKTKDQWEFGRLANPPHLDGCSVWRLHAAFRAKVL